MITPQQKLDLMRKARIDPGLAILHAIGIIRDEVLASNKAEMDKIRADFEAKLAQEAAKLPESVVLKHIERLKGDKGDSVDLEDVVRAVTPAAVEAAKKAGEEAAVSHVAQTIEQPQDGETPSDERLLSLIGPLIPKVKDGRTPTRGELLALMRPLIPVIEDMRPTEEEIRALIADMMPGDEDTAEAPSIEDILKELEPIIDAKVASKTRQQKGKYHAAHGGGAASSPTASTTAVDGVTKVFAVATRPVKVYADDSVFFENVTPGDGGTYTYSAGFVTMFFAPQNFFKYE